MLIDHRQLVNLVRLHELQHGARCHFRRNYQGGARYERFYRRVQVEPPQQAPSNVAVGQRAQQHVVLRYDKDYLQGGLVEIADSLPEGCIDRQQRSAPAVVRFIGSCGCLRQIWLVLGSMPLTQQLKGFRGHKTRCGTANGGQRPNGLDTAWEGERAQLGFVERHNFQFAL